VRADCQFKIIDRARGKLVAMATTGAGDRNKLPTTMARLVEQLSSSEQHSRVGTHVIVVACKQRKALVGKSHGIIVIVLRVF
jgi:hypothetical protein